MGTRLRRKKFTRKEKIELSKGITPKRLRDELNDIVKERNNEIKGRRLALKVDGIPALHFGHGYGDQNL